MKKKSEPTERLVPDRCQEALYNEMMTALSRIAEEHMHLPAFQFFVDVTRSWHEKMCGEIEKLLVVVAGTGIPDELLRAAGVVPSYILGGSREACMYSDDRVPRDADPVSRSILGYLYQMAVKDTSSLLILIPLYSDSMRKIAYQLNLAGWNVVTVDMPPLQDSSTALEKWKEQVLQATVAVADHVHTNIMLPYLSRQLGHKSPDETFYYYHQVRDSFRIIQAKDSLASMVLPEVRVR